MVDQVRQFLQADNWKQLAQDYNDFSSMKQSHLRDAMKKCGDDFEYPLDSKPYDTDHENFKYFAICLRNQVFLNPVLNQSKAVRNQVLGLDYWSKVENSDPAIVTDWIILKLIKTSIMSKNEYTFAFFMSDSDNYLTNFH